MNVSEAIKQLQEIQSLYGDLPLKVYIPGSPSQSNYRDISLFHASAFTPPTVIALYQVNYAEYKPY